MANAIVWQCRRTAGRCRELAAEPGMSRLIRKKTGLPIDAYFSATKAEWILDRGGLRERAKRGRLAFGTTDSWVLWKLTGGASHATDPTNASRTMLFNIRRLDWDDDLLELFGIPAAMLPQVLPSSGEFGRTVRLGRLPGGHPDHGHRRRPAGGPLRPGRLPAGRDQEHLRHGLLHPAQHRPRARRVEARPHHDRRLRPGRQGRLRPRRVRLRRRRGHPVAARPARPPRRGRGIGGGGRLRRRTTPASTSSRLSSASGRRTGTPRRGARSSA